MTDLPAGVSLWSATPAKIDEIWSKVKGFDRLFSDDTRWDEIAFATKMCSNNSIILEAPNGMVMVDIVHLKHIGRCHVIFWDKKLSPKTELLRDCLIWAFITLEFNVIEAQIPDYARALRRFIEKRMGFSYEGRLRDRLWYKGQLTDIIVLSILREEVLK